MHITLISCCYEKGNFSYPLGALSILTALQAKGMDATLQNYTLADSAEKAAEATKGDIVGCSIYLWNRSWFDRYASALKKKNPKVILFGGGTEVTANPKSFDLSFWNFLSLGEGEESVPRALEAIIEEGSVKAGDGIAIMGSPLVPSCPEELDKLPSVLLSHSADSMLKKTDTVLWELTRGCPFHCGFCFESKGIRSVRHYPMERIEAELDYLVAHHVKNIFLLDPTFNMDKARTVEILKLLQTKAPYVHFTFENRAELLDKEIVSQFAKLDCSLQIGMQSANATALKAIGRNENREKFTNGVNLLAKAGVTFGLDLIIGLPEDTLEEFKHSLDTAINLKPSNIDIFLLSLLPGTMLQERAEELGLVGESENPYLVQYTRTMSKEDIKEALRLKKAADLFYTKGQSYLWFSILAEACAMQPHRILSLFADYLDACGESDIYEMQDDFVRKLLKQLGKKALLPALLSFMELSQGIAFLLETGENPVVELSYDPDDLTELESESLETFTRTHRKTNVRLGIFQESDGTITFCPQ